MKFILLLMSFTFSFSSLADYKCQKEAKEAIIQQVKMDEGVFTVISVEQVEVAMEEQSSDGEVFDLLKVGFTYVTVNKSLFDGKTSRSRFVGSFNMDENCKSYNFSFLGATEAIENF